MTTPVAKKPSTLKRLALVVERLTMRVIDRHDVDVARLAALENRLAALDGGDDADAALGSAYATVRDGRDEGGKRPLSIVLRQVDGRPCLAPREKAPYR